MTSKRTYRIIFVILLVLCVLAPIYSYTTTASTTFEQHLNKTGVTTNQPIVQPRDHITVIATDSNSWLGKSQDGPRARSELVAFNPNGSVLYYNDTHTRYWDVDQVSGTKATVEYAYANNINASKCPTQWNYSAHAVDKKTWNRYLHARNTKSCTRDGFERVNLTTGNVTPIWSQITPGKEATRYHDIDRINSSRIVVADIYLDRVFVVNTKTNHIVWTWNPSSHYSTNNSGGPYPDDWTHINDVDVLPDGRIMVSVRNQDQVVFLTKHGKLIKNQTLGKVGNRSILYAQHNPDYIPKKNGGPAVIIADSDNNRLVEYQRVNGSWHRTWKWRDARMQWPRDADRLPNGHTLVTDSNGNRVFEINKQGKVVWNVNIAFPYEAERLNTGGPESAGGPSAQSAGLPSRTPGIIGWAIITAKNQLPGKYLNALMYITPSWLGFTDVFILAFGVGVLREWLCVEVVWFIRGDGLPRIREDRS